MNDYTNQPRGTIQCEKYAEQLRSYEGLLFKGRNGFYTVTPTDIDGLVQLDNENCFIIFELKHSGEMPGGQSDALTKLCDAIRMGGTECVVMLAEHNTPYPDVIIAKDAIVKKVYAKDMKNPKKNRWYIERKGRTLKEVALSFIDFIKED